MKLPRPVTVDFETLPIEDRPRYPPPAVGVSIKYWGKKAKYWSFGHPTANTCSWGEARAALALAYACPDGLLFQNGKFDLDVAEAEFALAVPAWQLIHDTMLLLFLDDPHQTELGLKPSAERLLDLPPEERDAVVDWLVAKQPLADRGHKLSDKPGSPKYAGVMIALAPGDLVGRYANGDTDRTAALFQLLYPKTVARGMLGAYDRERHLLPLLLAMERRGLAVDLPGLRQAVAVYGAVSARLDAWLRKRLKRGEDLNLDSGEQLVRAMLALGLADEAALGVTATGKPQSNKDALLGAVTDRQLLAALNYRAGLKTCLGTFMGPWLAMAERSGGRIYASWNQVRAPKGDDTAGTRTGRLSATWFMNMPKEMKVHFREHDPADKRLPKVPFPHLPPLPSCRTFIVPFPGHALIDRDYSQQEPRILAHFDGGELLDRYNAEPWVDFHDYAKAELERVGLFYERKPVKNTNLGLIYGMGVGKLAAKNDMAVEDAKGLQKAVLALYPGLQAMRQDMKRRAQADEPIRTWGGREYFCEPPKLIEGRWRTFDYKLVNVLIQGSAADCTKEAILRLDAALTELGKQDVWFLLLNVHDQLTMSVPRKDVKQAMAVLQVAMEGVAFDVPMLTEGTVSEASWGALRDYDKKGQPITQPRKAA